MCTHTHTHTSTFSFHSPSFILLLSVARSACGKHTFGLLVSVLHNLRCVIRIFIHFTCSFCQRFFFRLLQNKLFLPNVEVFHTLVPFQWFFFVDFNKELNICVDISWKCRYSSSVHWFRSCKLFCIAFIPFVPTPLIESNGASFGSQKIMMTHSMRVQVYTPQMYTHTHKEIPNPVCVFVYLLLSQKWLLALDK